MSATPGSMVMVSTAMSNLSATDRQNRRVPRYGRRAWQEDSKELYA